MTEQPPTHEYPIEGHVCRGRPPELSDTEPWTCYEGPYVAADEVWLIHPSSEAR